MGPNSPRIRSTPPATDSPEVTSSSTKVPPTSEATLSPFALSMSQTATLAPSALKRWAMPSPIPDAAPVTIASLLSSRMLPPAPFLIIVVSDCPGD